MLMVFSKERFLEIEGKLEVEQEELWVNELDGQLISELDMIAALKDGTELLIKQEWCNVISLTGEADEEKRICYGCKKVVQELVDISGYGLCQECARVHQEICAEVKKLC